MSLNYTTFVTSIANLLAVDPNNAEFQLVLPNIIDDAEQRIYRELNLLATVVTDTGLTSAFNRNFNLPTNTGTFYVVNQINVITPSSQTDPNAGTRNPMVPIAKEYLDVVWPSQTGATVPTNFAMLTQGSIVLGPWPDDTYTIEVVGTQRPTPLSASNPTTILTTLLPDLFIAAAMVFGAAYQKNFGASADQPQMATSWESHYQALLQSANTEENRKKWAVGPWASQSPTPLAAPQRE